MQAFSPKYIGPKDFEPEALPQLGSKLPKRADFIRADTELCAYVKEEYAKNKPMLFYPIDIKEHDISPTEGERWRYQVMLYGITLDGAKTVVRIDDVEPYVLVKIPEDIKSPNLLEKPPLFSVDAYAELLKDSLEHADKPTKIAHYDTVELKPSIYFQTYKSKYIRLYFDTKWQRKRAIEFLGATGRAVGGYNVKIATDDKVRFYDEISRNLRTPFSGWIILQGYQKLAPSTDAYVPGNSYSITSENVFIGGLHRLMSISLPTVASCLHPVGPPKISRGIEGSPIYDAMNAVPLLRDPIKKPRGLVCAFDIETRSNRQNGEVPSVNVKTLDDVANETVFMISMVFYWQASKVPIYRLCITDMLCELPELTPSTATKTESPGNICLIKTKSQLQTLKMFKTMLGYTKPDYLTHFNGGTYDIPFVMNRAKLYQEKYNKVAGNIFYEILAACSVERIDFTAQWRAYGMATKKVKLEANEPMQEDTIINVPGMLCVDVRTIFRQTLPGKEQSSLNFYLNECKLSSKELMHYQTMFHIYKCMEYLENISNCHDYRTLMAWLKDMSETIPDAKFLDSEKYTDAERESFDAINLKHFNKRIGVMYINTDPDLRHMSTLVIYALALKAYDVAWYCIVDSIRCQDLLLARNIMMDRTAVAEGSFTLLSDAFYKAGGMKVRSLAMIDGHGTLAFSQYSDLDKKKTDAKYPGAFVVPPNQGCYRDDNRVKLERLRTTVKYMEKHHLTLKDSSEKRKAEEIIDHIQTSLLKAGIDPKNDSYVAECIRLHNVLEEAQVMSRLIPTAKDIGSGNNDVSPDMDRPCAGLDYASLYPNIIINGNITPEMIIPDAPTDHRDYAIMHEHKLRYINRLKETINPMTGNRYELSEISFPYGPKDGEKVEIRGWVVKHGKITDPAVAARQGLKVGDIGGMGLYPKTLKGLFDKRVGVKAKVEYYNLAREFVGSVRNQRNKERLSELYDLPVKEQIVEIKMRMEAERHVRERVYKEKPVDFNKHRIHNMKEIEEFMEKEWFSDEAVEANGSFTAGSAAVGDNIRHHEPLGDAMERWVFLYNYYNAVQLAIKIFMNTFYGEAGNQLSPFFVKHVAGKVTSDGQYYLKKVKALVESWGYTVLYGDTDSLYVCCPEEIFTESVVNYLTGKIDKLTYWTELVEKTMLDLNICKDRINAHLFEATGAKFLKMAYEEVLWPFAMLGKKKYIGIQHMGIVNFSLCMPTCTLDEFSKSSLLFIRGLEMKKRGASSLLRKISYEFWQRVFRINQDATMMQIAYTMLNETAENTYDLGLYVKKAKYKLAGFKPDGTPKQGNATVLPFVKRMMETAAQFPNIGIKIPELGERFDYIVTSRHRYEYDIKGRKTPVKVAAKMEMVVNMTNDAYANAIKCPGIGPDKDYYIEGEVIGQLGRFIVYHPAFNAYITRMADSEALGVNLSSEDQDELYKELDEKAVKAARKTLREVYRERYGAERADLSERNKKLYKMVMKPVNTEILARDPDNGHYFSKIFEAMISTSNTKSLGGNLQNDNIHNFKMDFGKRTATSIALTAVEKIITKNIDAGRKKTDLNTVCKAICKKHEALGLMTSGDPKSDDSTKSKSAGPTILWGVALAKLFDDTGALFREEMTKLKVREKEIRVLLANTIDMISNVVAPAILIQVRTIINVKSNSVEGVDDKAATIDVSIEEINKILEPYNEEIASRVVSCCTKLQDVRTRLQYYVDIKKYMIEKHSGKGPLTATALFQDARQDLLDMKEFVKKTNGAAAWGMPW